ncbi:hypothetical protein DFJ67_5741 [Asanoa ferruginea]|uniref:Uncharacterized protein n=1 Tax=Asanoa ferruginea TaxID=53367 RepID=A0A3D9ZR72_9ACTN|nr:hypothetical protein [Asanoa ferruginea]REF99701.1 hypothetical protein DFJ67_5741 [Asanoa ferruginea]GIF50411.1 hypothetical protein Afe04nite_49500 [Asanoa ferruginea]
MSDERTTDEFALDLRVETEPPLASGQHMTGTGTAPADFMTGTGTAPVS